MCKYNFLTKQPFSTFIILSFFISSSYLIIIYTKMKFKARNIKFYVCIILLNLILLKILCYRLASVFVRFWDVMEYPAIFIGLHPWQNNLKIVKYKNGNIWTISIEVLASYVVHNTFGNEDKAWKEKQIRWRCCLFLYFWYYIWDLELYLNILWKFRWDFIIFRLL